MRSSWDFRRPRWTAIWHLEFFGIDWGPESFHRGHFGELNTAGAPPSLYTIKHVDDSADKLVMIDRHKDNVKNWNSRVLCLFIFSWIDFLERIFAWDCTLGFYKLIELFDCTVKWFHCWLYWWWGASWWWKRKIWTVNFLDLNGGKWSKIPKIWKSSYKYLVIVLLQFTIDCSPAHPLSSVNPIVHKNKWNL